MNESIFPWKFCPPKMMKNMYIEYLLYELLIRITRAHLIETNLTY